MVSSLSSQADGYIEITIVGDVAEIKGDMTDFLKEGEEGEPSSKKVVHILKYSLENSNSRTLLFYSCKKLNKEVSALLKSGKPVTMSVTSSEVQ